jgi:hypothetical protein
MLPIGQSSLAEVELMCCATRWPPFADVPRDCASALSVFVDSIKQINNHGPAAQRTHMVRDDRDRTDTKQVRYRKKDERQGFLFVVFGAGEFIRY